jgi:hypothetical protein
MCILLLCKRRCSIDDVDLIEFECLSVVCKYLSFYLVLFYQIRVFVGCVYIFVFLSGFDCGVTLRGNNDLQVGDQLEIFEIREVARTL